MSKSPPPELVAKLSEVSNDAKVRSLVEALECAIERVKTGNWKECDGLLIVASRKEDGGYYHGYERAGLHHSDSIALLEVTKYTMLREMEA